MKRHPPQTLLLLAARRSLVPLACALFAAAVLGSVPPPDLATCAVPPSQPDSLSAKELAKKQVAKKQHVTLRLTPLLTLAAIEEAWNVGCADSIVALLPAEKITLRLETNVPEEASFSREQAAYMLKDALRYTVTESFQFLDFTYAKEEGAEPSGNAEWSYRREPQAERVTKKVHVTLRKEKDRWLISELRILD